MLSDINRPGHVTGLREGTDRALDGVEELFDGKLDGDSLHLGRLVNDLTNSSRVLEGNVGVDLLKAFLRNCHPTRSFHSKLLEGITVALDNSIHIDIIINLGRFMEKRVRKIFGVVPDVSS